MTGRRLAVVLLLAGGCATAVAPRERSVGPTPVLTVKWRYHLTDEPLIEYKPQEFAVATSDGRRVYVGSSGGIFYAFDARDGDIVWRRKVVGAVGGQPLHVPSLRLVIVGTQGGVLHGLDEATGEERWRYAVKGPIDAQPAYADGLVFFTTGENRVYALDAKTGAWRWQYDRESPESFTIRGHSAPLWLNGRVYVGFSDGYLACLVASTGDVAWTRALFGDATRFVDVDATPVYADGVLYVSSYSGGVYALDPKDGSTRWRYEVEGAGTVAVAGDRVYFSAAKHGLHCLDREGRVVWRQALAKGGELSAPLVVGGLVLVSSAARGTYIADARSGRLYQFFAPGHGVTSQPTSDGRQVYIMSNGGYFYALGLTG